MSSSYSYGLESKGLSMASPCNQVLLLLSPLMSTIKLSSLKRTTGLTPPCQVGGPATVVALSRCYNIQSVRQTLVLSAHAQSPGTAAFPMYNSSLSRPPNNLRSVSRLSPPRREPRRPPETPNHSATPRDKIVSVLGEGYTCWNWREAIIWRIIWFPLSTWAVVKNFQTG